MRRSKAPAPIEFVPQLSLLAHISSSPGDSASHPLPNVEHLLACMTEIPARLCRSRPATEFPPGPALVDQLCGRWRTPQPRSVCAGASIFDGILDTNLL